MYGQVPQLGGVMPVSLTYSYHLGQAKKWPFWTILYNFSPLWTILDGLSFKTMGIFEILTKALCMEWKIQYVCVVFQEEQIHQVFRRKM